MSGGTEWIQHSIIDKTLVAVTDGSYIRELYPNLCSAAFVIECAKGRGRIAGSFLEHLDGKCILRGAPRIHGDSLNTTQRELNSPQAERRSGDCLGLLGGVEQSLIPPSV